MILAFFHKIWASIDSKIKRSLLHVDSGLKINRYGLLCGGGAGVAVVGTDDLTTGARAAATGAEAGAGGVRREL